nr:hypothetical protein [Acinetobacter baumannii]
MQKKWLILTIIVLIYLPVTIDATVMHVATPSLSAALNLTANQLLMRLLQQLCLLLV